MAERIGIAVAAAFVSMIVAPASPAVARVQEYQIVRLVTLKSNCRIEHFEDRSPPTGPLRFLATCENLTFYPDGVVVLCDDRDDDRSCRVATLPLRFDSLDLLHRSRPPPESPASIPRGRRGMFDERTR